MHIYIERERHLFIDSVFVDPSPPDARYVKHGPYCGPLWRPGDPFGTFRDPSAPKRALLELQVHPRDPGMLKSKFCLSFGIILEPC